MFGGVRYFPFVFIGRLRRMGTVIRRNFRLKRRNARDTPKTRTSRRRRARRFFDSSAPTISISFVDNYRSVDVRNTPGFSRSLTDIYNLFPLSRVRPQLLQQQQQQRRDRRIYRGIRNSPRARRDVSRRKVKAGPREKCYWRVYKEI